MCHPLMRVHWIIEGTQRHRLGFIRVRDGVLNPKTASIDMDDESPDFCMAIGRLSCRVDIYSGNDLDRSWSKSSICTCSSSGHQSLQSR